MSENMISAIVLEQLKEALCSIYWYKNQLKGFLLNCISNKNIVNNADWSKYKVQIVSDIIDELSYNQEKYLGDLRRLIHEVTKINDFRHLFELEDGKKKADRAKQAVTTLKNSVEDNDSKIKEEEKIAILRKENREKINSSKAV